MPPFVFILLLVIIGVTFATFTLYLDHKRQTGGTIDPKALEKAMGDLTAALEAGEAERERLGERVRNLEAIVATETYDLLKSAPSPEEVERVTARLDAALLDEQLQEDPLADTQSAEDAARAEELARLARRMRG
ncbi:MAG: hypothetical protein AAGG50_02695 [Bacteroidota bacterium]